MNKKYGFIYLTTNDINGKKYIGQRKYHYNNLRSDEKYMGSGCKITRAIKKYGIEHFSKIILEECDTAEELNQAEIKWIAEYHAINNSEFYNIAIGGNAGDNYSGQSYYKKRKYRKIITESNRRRKRDVSKISGKNNPAFGRHWYKDTVNRKQYYLFENDPLIIELNLVRGMFRTKKHNKKIGDANRGKAKQYTVHAKGRKCINDGIKNKFVLPEEVEEYIQKGYVLRNVNYNLKNKVHMNDGTKNYCISKNKVEYYISKGFILGWIKISE